MGKSGSNARPAPVAARSFRTSFRDGIVGGEGQGSAGRRRSFYISRSKSRFTCACSRTSSCTRSCSDSSERSSSRSVSRPGPDSRSRSGSNNVLLFEGAICPVNCARRRIAVAFEGRFEAERRLVRGLHRRPIERRNPLARGSLQLIRELPGIVGDQLGPVPGPADRHVERSLVRQVRVPRGHGGNDLIHRPALESVHRRGKSPVQVPELGVVFGKFRRRSVLETEADAVLTDRFHRRGLPVCEP